jgi:hypothetical protein
VWASIPGCSARRSRRSVAYRDSRSIGYGYTERPADRPDRALSCRRVVAAKKMIAGVALGLMVVGLPTAALAGEITGNGKPTPIRRTANSECAFSGQWR